MSGAANPGAALPLGTERRLPRRQEPAGGELVMLTVEAPANRAARFLDVAGAGDPMLWSPAAGDADGWTFAGVGVAARVDASGADRIGRVREAAARIFASVRGAAVRGEPPVRLFGGFSFRESEEDLGAWSSFGDASFTLPRLVYAERAGRAWIRAYVDVGECGAIDAAVPALYRLRARLAEPASGEARDLHVIRTEELARDEWSCRVSGALEVMRARSLTKVVLARRTRVELDCVPSAAALAAALPSESGATRFAFGRRGSLFTGATPERLVALREGRLRCDALGGSHPRVIDARTGGLDSEREAETLRHSAKDGREHAEVVAGIRAALAPLATQLAADGPRVRTLATVHHLHTEVTGAAHADVDVLALVEALHPTPAVCGTPRLAAREWIAANEGAPRGWYAGPVGWIDANGEGSFCVALRCALVTGSEAWLYAGAGLVEGSDADAEWRETAAKQAPMLRALGGLA